MSTVSGEISLGQTYWTTLNSGLLLRSMLRLLGIQPYRGCAFGPMMWPQRRTPANPEDKVRSIGRPCNIPTPTCPVRRKVWTANNCNIRHVAILRRQLTQPSISLGLANEDRLQLRRQRQVWLIPSEDKQAGGQATPWNCLTMRAIPQCSCDTDASYKGATSSVKCRLFTPSRQ